MAGEGGGLLEEETEEEERAREFILLCVGETSLGYRLELAFR